MKQAKELARVYRAFDGQVTFYMLPWSTVLFRSCIQKLESVLNKKRTEFDPAETFFPAAETLTVAIEFADDLTPELQGLKAYWEGRGTDLAANFECYMRYLSQDVYNAWLIAYGATRDTSVAAKSDPSTPPPGDTKKKKPATKPAPTS